MQIEIDGGSGFCFGVTTAIKKAEEELAKGTKLYCLGDIVHNSMEVERLEQIGLVTINHEQMKQLRNVKVLLRAHGEPPETYELAKRNNIEIIDATCPVVLALQRRIKMQFEKSITTPGNASIVIFGKKGHAEVLGLVGQTNSRAIYTLKPLKISTNSIKSYATFRTISRPRLHFAVLIPFAGRLPTECPIFRPSRLVTTL